MNEEHAQFDLRRIIATGDEIHEHVLAEQGVHIEDEGEHKGRGEREQDVSSLDPVLSGRGKDRAAKFETEQDDREVERGLDRDMRRKGRPTKQRGQRPAQNEAVEGPPEYRRSPRRSARRAPRRISHRQRAPARHAGREASPHKLHPPLRRAWSPRECLGTRRAIVGTSSSCGRLVARHLQSNKH